MSLVRQALEQLAAKQSLAPGGDSTDLNAWLQAAGESGAATPTTPLPDAAPVAGFGGLGLDATQSPGEPFAGTSPEHDAPLPKISFFSANTPIAAPLELSEPVEPAPATSAVESVTPIVPTRAAASPAAVPKPSSAPAPPAAPSIPPASPAVAPLPLAAGNSPPSPAPSEGNHLLARMFGGNLPDIATLVPAAPIKPTQVETPRAMSAPIERAEVVVTAERVSEPVKPRDEPKPKSAAKAKPTETRLDLVAGGILSPLSEKRQQQLDTVVEAIAKQLRLHRARILLLAAPNAGREDARLAVRIAALLAAGENKPTLLLDAEMKGRAISRLCGVDDQPGWGDALLGWIPWPTAIRQTTSNSLGLIGLGSAKQAELAAACQQQALPWRNWGDAVHLVVQYVGDPTTAPVPLLNAADASCLLVHPADRRRRWIEAAAQALQSRHGPCLGIVAVE